jgi:hypothetical protein
MLNMIFFSELLLVYMIILCSRRLNDDHNTSYAAGRPRIFKRCIPKIFQTKPPAQFNIPTAKRIVLSSYFVTASYFRRIRIRIRLRILLSLSKNGNKNLDFYCFVTFFSLFIFENDVNVSSKSNMQKNFEKNSF